jgi:hypothetical protein
MNDPPHQSCPNLETCGYCPKHRSNDHCPLLLEEFGILARQPAEMLTASYQNWLRDQAGRHCRKEALLQRRDLLSKSV